MEEGAAFHADLREGGGVSGIRARYSSLSAEFNADVQVLCPELDRRDAHPAIPPPAPSLHLLPTQDVLSGNGVVTV
jgi:hypothetical protein